MATFYWIVQPAAVANPTGAQIVAGLNGEGASAIASGRHHPLMRRLMLWLHFFISNGRGYPPAPVVKRGVY